MEGYFKLRTTKSSKHRPWGLNSYKLESTYYNDSCHFWNFLYCSPS